MMPMLLLILVFLPLLVGFALLMGSGLSREQARGMALATSLAALAGAGWLAVSFPTGSEDYQYVLDLPWVPVGHGGGVHFALGLDGASLWLLVMTPILVAASIFCSWETIAEHAPRYYGLVMLLMSGLLGLFASLDVVLFYVFFEFTLIPTFFLIGLYGGPERRPAALTFFIYTLAGSLLTLLGVIALVAIQFQHGPDGRMTFSIPELTRNLAQLGWPEWKESGSLFRPSKQGLVFLLLLAGFAIKMPLVPLHSWLPRTYQQAPMAVTILLAGVMSKLGAYGFFRFNLGMTPLGAHEMFGLVAALALVTILYGALAALAQTDLKQLIAYSSLSHMGFIALGMIALNSTGLDGAVIQMVNHAITIAALFLCLEVIRVRYQTLEVDLIGGLWQRLPLFAFFLVTALLASAALPGLNGFVGEFPILLGTFKTSASVGTWAAMGMILGAYYLIAMLRRVVYGPMPDRLVELSRPLAMHERIGLWPLTALMFVLGLAPNLVLERMRPAVEQVGDRVATQAPNAPPVTVSRDSESLPRGNRAP